MALSRAISANAASSVASSKRNALNTERSATAETALCGQLQASSVRTERGMVSMPMPLTVMFPS